MIQPTQKMRTPQERKVCEILMKHNLCQYDSRTEAAITELAQAFADAERDGRTERAMCCWTMEKALTRIARGTHDEHPTCMTLPSGEFGPPRTKGWEGWAREIDQLHKQIAREALEVKLHGTHT